LGASGRDPRKIFKELLILDLGGIDSGGKRQRWYMASSNFGKVWENIAVEGYNFVRG
jgi:hypothetical protein